MKIRMTFEFDDRCRRAIGNQDGNRRASREEVIGWIHATIESTLESVLADYDLAVSEGHAHVPD